MSWIFIQETLSQLRETKRVRKTTTGMRTKYDGRAKLYVWGVGAGASGSWNLCAMVKQDTRIYCRENTAELDSPCGPIWGGVKTFVPLYTLSVSWQKSIYPQPTWGVGSHGVGRKAWSGGVYLDSQCPVAMDVPFSSYDVNLIPREIFKDNENIQPIPAYHMHSGSSQRLPYQMSPDFI